MKRSAPMKRGKPLKASGTTKAKKVKRYKSFLSSAAWKRIRKAALERAGYQCQQTKIAGDRHFLGGEWVHWMYRCPATDTLTAHHLTYTRFGGTERPEDLQVLCKRCHDEVSALEGRRIA